MRKEILIEEVGNAYKLQLRASDPVAGGVPYPHGKPVVVLDTAEDAALGKTVRDLLRTRIRAPRKAKTGEAVAA